MSINTKKKNRGMSERQAFRADPKVNAEFERLIDLGGFNKSSVFRLLQQRWIQEQNAKEAS